MSKVSIKGVLLGGITDVVATNILALPLVIYVMTSLDLAHTPSDRAAAALSAALRGNPWLHATELLIGITCSMLGGYVAAWIAKHDELLNGFLASYLCITIGIYGLIAGKTSDPAWLQALLLAASSASGLLGGYLRLVQKRARSSPPPQPA